jgi:hypothetical protein
MAFPTASGYGNLPSGNFTPVIYSQKVLKFLRRASVIEDITNTDYAGEISSYGDTVNIILEPTVAITPYTRGSVLVPTDLADDQTQLIIDKANAFAFKVDDIEVRQSHINWQPLAQSAAAYALKDAFDAEVLSVMVSNVASANLYGTVAAPIDTGFDTSEVDPVNVIARLARLLDSQNVPEDNRFLVARPAFYEQLSQSASKVMDMSVIKFGDESALRNGMVTKYPVHGFKLYKSNNLAIPTGAGSPTDYVMAGHMSSTAVAAQIAKTEVIRDTNSFGDIVRGLHVYGRKVLRPECLALATIKID